VLYLVICAAPPVLKISELVGLLQEQGWTVCLVATPRAASWIDCGALAEQTGYPVRHDYEQDPLPKADLVVVVPATFNTINKWVMGINDSFALGLLNEVFGLRLPVVVVPYAKPTLAAHPVFARNLGALGEWGVMVLANEAIRVERDVFEWRVVVEACAGFLGAT
jgi:phosphopantothenoylcysteine synthetase/decarboxylase